MSITKIMLSTRYLYETMKTVSNMINGPMYTKSFQHTGKLTPNEFVDACDTMIQKIPSWKWSSVKSHLQPYLPDNKKFLVSDFCYSMKRVNTLLNTIVENNLGDWVEFNNTVANAVVNCIVNGDGDGNGDGDDNEDGDGDVRRYDLTIIYDEYYCVPRLYLFGYDNDNKPLSRNQMLDDIDAENREKIVTVDMHPYLKIPAMSIHPCRHAETMLRMMTRLEKSYHDDIIDGNEFVFPSHYSLFLFLQFVEQIIPTIQLDIPML